MEAAVGPRRRGGGRVAAALGLAVACACSGGEDTQTPTPTSPSLLPADARVVGGLLVGFGQGYDLSTGQLGGAEDASATVLGAAFLAPDEATGGEGTPAPLPFGFPIQDVSLETCLYTELAPEAAPRVRAAAAPGDATPTPLSLPLTDVGDAVTVTVDGVAHTLPRVEPEDLPPPFRDQALPPFYMISSDGLDAALYVEGGAYGIDVPGGEAVAGFTAADLVKPPAPLTVTWPALGGERVEIPLDAAAPLSWEASTAAWVAIDLRSTTGAGLSCVVADDGAFTLPAADLSRLPEGDALLTLARVRVGFVEVRPGEIFVGLGAAAVSGAVELKAP